MSLLRGGSWRISLVLILAAGSPIAWSVEAGGPEGTKTPPTESAAAQPVAQAADQPPAEETPEQARRRELRVEHGAEIAEAILGKTALKGMTMEQVRLALGDPNRKEAIPPDAELWYYPNGEVAFSAGHVTYVSLGPALAAPPASVQKAVEPRDDAIHDLIDAPPPDQVGAPPIQVGDSYVYESLDPADPSSGVSTRRTVTSTKGKVTLSSLNLDNKRAKPRMLYFDRQWNLISTRSPDNSGKDYSSPLKYYDFPLFPGKTWDQTSTETDIKTGATRTHRISGTVVGWERMSVPAGTFRAIKVHLVTELFDPSTGERIRGTDTSWYVPEVRRSVRSETTGKGGRRGVIQLLSYEVK